ncbi:zinc finger protein 14-like [Elysia marginata]|uniref:Zinc finger protein 14-like n=1 Tax=Elysia marginata TaxID=1093978 RepID=A0AAV4I7T2_9GAST|nr:zinc finger protein 14-like [Elysia marginata]
MTRTSGTSRASPPDFSYDAFPRGGSGGVATGGGGGARDGGPPYGSSRAPPSPANSALSLGYPGVAEFPYGLSGVQMPTYNFGSELYNYVSNGFPRKSRMCTFCNKVFTRSTTRRYHERRCPLLRASNSLAKSEENSAAAAAALKEQQQQQQQRHKEASSRIPRSLPSPSAGSRGLNGMVHASNRERDKERDGSHHLNGGLGLLGGRHTPPQLRQAPVPERSGSPPPASLHPAYPASFPPGAASALASSPSRAAAAAAAYSYAQTYGSHFYNSISAAALASLDQNSNKNKKDGRHPDGNTPSPWASSALSPTSKPWDHHEHHNHGGHLQHHHHHPNHSNPLLPGAPTSSSSLALGSRNGDLPGKSSLANSIMSSLGVDLTSRYCADFSIRSQPAVFPTSHDRGGAPVSPNSPEPGETRSSSSHERRRSPSPPDGHAASLVTSMSSRQNGTGWASPPGRAGERREDKEERVSYQDQYSLGFQDKIQTSNISGARLKTTSPPLNSWNAKAPFSDSECKSPKEPPPFMAVRPLDEDEEEEEEDEEAEEEMEEDEEQFNETGSGASREDSLIGKSGKSSLDFPGLDGKRNHPRSSTYNPLVCNICKKSFSDTFARQAHEALHSQAKAFACALCDRSFHCAFSLRIHFLRHHSAGGPYSCKYCPQKFDSALALKAHLVTQHVLSKEEARSLKYFSLLEEPTGSPRSSSSSGGRISIGSHRSAMSDSERDCKINENGDIRGRASPSQRRSAESLPDILGCRDDYDTAKAIHDRMRKKNGAFLNELSPQSRVLPLADGELGASAVRDAVNKPEKEEETEVCKVCNKSFAKSFIRFHERSHADQKPYECSICHKRFGYKNNMKSHMKLHQGLKPYQCQICGARFTRGSTLRRHGRRHNISRNSMLEYVLYDHSAGPTRAVGVTSKTGSATSTPTAAAAAASQHAVAVASSLYAQQMASRISPNDQSGMPRSGPPPAQLGFSPALSRQDSACDDRYSQPAAMTRRSSPPHTSPQSLTSRATGNHHLTTQAMASPMVGGLAAVAAANLFGYPAAAAPHLYQLYASANPLMNYPHGYPPAPHPHHNTQPAPAVQSDALNLSLGKRKSPFQEEEKIEKAARRSSDSSRESGSADCDLSVNDRRNNDVHPEPFTHPRSEAIKIETEELRENGGEREASSNPFTPIYSPKKEASPFKKDTETGYLNNDQRNNSQISNHHRHQPHIESCGQYANDGSTNKPVGDQKAELKISTEDFAAQVNFCCPSPLVQSSTGHACLNRSSSNTGSPPVGSTSSFTSPLANSTTTAAGSTTENVMARASPSGHVSHPNSPDNTTTTTTSPIPSPTAESDGSGVISFQGDGMDGHDGGKLNHKKALNNSLQELLLSLITAGRMFRCSFCDIYFTEYAMFRLHMKYHQCDHDRPFVCSVCGEDCKDKTYFTVHLSEHLGLGTKQALA